VSALDLRLNQSRRFRFDVDRTQVIDFHNDTLGTISWFGEKLVRIEFTASRDVFHFPGFPTASGLPP
jgi:hypothetical protein